MRRLGCLGGMQTPLLTRAFHTRASRPLARHRGLARNHKARRELRRCASLDLLGGRAVPAYYDDGHNTPPENINSDDDDPYNRPGMTSWRRNTPAFTIIRVLADLRQRSKAVPAGSYNPVYADDNVLVFERRYGTKSSSSPSIAAPPRRSRSEAVWTYRLAPIVASLPIPAKSTKETR